MRYIYLHCVLSKIVHLSFLYSNLLVGLNLEGFRYGLCWAVCHLKYLRNPITAIGSPLLGHRRLTILTQMFRRGLPKHRYDDTYLWHVLVVVQIEDEKKEEFCYQL